MSLERQMKTGEVYVEFGHTSPEDIAYEKKIEEQRMVCKERCFAYNQTPPSDVARREEILGALLGSAGKSLWMEPPIHFAYGCNTHIGSHVYANFNLTVVDDGGVFIGDYTMFAPNVVISTTGHPIHPMYRDKGAQFSLPVHIGAHVWIGANVVILPGVTIGDNSVIGAGSVVTHDVPPDTVAYGVPCRAVRAITQEDLKRVRSGVDINEDWNR